MSDFTVSPNSVKKQAVIDDIRDKFSRAQGIVLLDYRGLSVSEDNDLRAQLRNAGVEYRVMKNTMITRAANELEIEGLTEYLAGPTAVAFSYDDPTTGARVLSDFIDKAKKTEIKCGVLGKETLDAQRVQALAKLPSKEELIAKMLGSLNGGVTGLVYALSGVSRGLVTALSAVADQKQSA
jgi:large subunit ribosomal protein L10